MAKYCAQCGDLVYPEKLLQPDFAGVAKKPDECVPVECAGCGPTFVNRLGYCIFTNCPVHGHAAIMAPLARVGEGKKT